MGKRVQLSEQDLDNVSGGAFNFYTKDAENRCYVDGVGTFLCSPEASTWVVEQIAKTGSPIETVVEKAVEEGLFWR